VQGSIISTSFVRIGDPGNLSVAMGTNAVLTGSGSSNDGTFFAGSGLALRFYTSEIERARFPSAGGFQAVTTISVGNATPSSSGAGITFPATQSASSDANTLDDYEEGTFEPALVCGTSGTITIQNPSTTSLMNYTKIGRVVTVSGLLIISAVSSPVGALSLTGLPFPTGSTRGARAAISIYAGGLSATAVTALQARTDASSSSLFLSKFSAGADVDTLASDVTSSTFIYIGGTYTV
jgi:hypothetical protein